MHQIAKHFGSASVLLICLSCTALFGSEPYSAGDIPLLTVAKRKSMANDSLRAFLAIIQNSDELTLIRNDTIYPDMVKDAQGRWVNGEKTIDRTIHIRDINAIQEFLASLSSLDGIISGPCGCGLNITIAFKANNRMLAYLSIIKDATLVLSTDGAEILVSNPKQLHQWFKQNNIRF